MNGQSNTKPRRLARVFCIVVMTLLLAACGETATTTDGGSGQENEPSVVYEMTLETSEETPPPETTAEGSPEPDAEEASQQATDGPRDALESLLGALAAFGYSGKVAVQDVTETGVSKRYEVETG